MTHQAKGFRDNDTKNHNALLKQLKNKLHKEMI